jgi:hypothetical protein
MDSSELEAMIWMAVPCSLAFLAVKGFMTDLEKYLLNRYSPNSRFTQEINRSYERCGLIEPDLIPGRTLRFEFTEFPTFRALYRYITRK